MAADVLTVGSSAVTSAADVAEGTIVLSGSANAVLGRFAQSMVGHVTADGKGKLNSEITVYGDGKISLQGTASANAESDRAGRYHRGYVR